MGVWEWEKALWFSRSSQLIMKRAFSSVVGPGLRVTSCGMYRLFIIHFSFPIG